MQFEEYEELIPSFHRYPRRKRRDVNKYTPTFTYIKIGTDPDRYAYVIGGISWGYMKGKTFHVYMPQQKGSAIFGVKVFRKTQDESLVAHFEELVNGKIDGVSFDIKTTDPYWNEMPYDDPYKDYYIQTFYVENVEAVELSGMYFSEVEEYYPERSDYAEFVKICLKQGVEYANLLDSFREKFSLDYATGVQLDILGNLVGVSRALPFAIQDNLGVNVTHLSDEDLRMLIRAKIARNNWDGTMESLARLCNEIFTEYDVSFKDLSAEHRIGDSNYVNMKYRYIIRGNISNSQRVMIMNDMIMPRPAGVEVEYEINSAVEAAQIAVVSIVSYDYKGTEQGSPIPIVRNN